MPITYLLGEDSTDAVHRLHQKMAAAVPEMRTVTVRRATHALHIQTPDSFVLAVIEAYENRPQRSES